MNKSSPLEIMDFFLKHEFVDCWKFVGSRFYSSNIKCSIKITEEVQTVNETQNSSIDLRKLVRSQKSVIQYRRFKLKVSKNCLVLVSRKISNIYYNVKYSCHHGIFLVWHMMHSIRIFNLF